DWAVRSCARTHAPTGQTIHWRIVCLLTSHANGVSKSKKLRAPQAHNRCIWSESATGAREFLNPKPPKMPTKDLLSAAISKFPRGGEVTRPWLQHGHAPAWTCADFHPR